MTDVEYGPINNAVVSPQVSFVLWYKRLSDMSGTAEGLFANSGADQTDQPASFRILAKAEENFIEGM